MVKRLPAIGGSVLVATAILWGAGRWFRGDQFYAAIVRPNYPQCEGIPVDSATGERLMYCCLDKIYIMQQEGADEEIRKIHAAMLRAEFLSPAELREFFSQQYTGPIHEKYGWDTICGDPIPCELCGMYLLCGNGTLDPGEQCDDGNTKSGDGCGVACAVESGYTCEGEPSQCRAVRRPIIQRQDPPEDAVPPPHAAAEDKPVQPSIEVRHVAQLPNPTPNSQLPIPNPTPNSPLPTPNPTPTPLLRLQHNAPLQDAGPPALLFMSACMAAGAGYLYKRARN